MSLPREYVRYMVLEYICNLYIAAAPNGKNRGRGLVPEACASLRLSNRTPAKTSWANLGSWGISWMGNNPRSTRALEISMTNYDSCPSSVVRSPPIPSTRT
jgi:hypothetical protein